jgi:Spy/CpxP family protein refolding chaperone
MKKIIVAISVITLIATSGLALAQGWGRGAGMGQGPGPGPCAPGYGPGGWAAALNLTPEQTQKMQTLRETHFKETIPLRNEIMSKKIELQSLWIQANPDQEKILAKQREINAVKAQLQEKAIKHRLEMRQVLTPEQQAKIGAFRGRHGGSDPGYGMRGGYGPGRGMGWGAGNCPRW